MESMPMVATQTPLSNAWRESVKWDPQLPEHGEKFNFKSVYSYLVSANKKTLKIQICFLILSVRFAEQQLHPVRFTAFNFPCNQF